MKTILLKVICLIGISTVQMVQVQAQLAKCKGKYFGNITASNVQSTYTALWNQMTMENESKWSGTEGTQGRYNFTASDRGFNWAKNNGGLFKYHTLMWGAQTPGWVANASSATLQASIPLYFKAVADHYNAIGGLKIMDVLNEPINTAVASNLKNALAAGYKAEPANAGDINNQYGWAIWCFQLARRDFPNAVLLINEFNIEMNWNNCRAPYIAMSNAIKNAPNLTDGKKNLIDGIGLQAHGIGDLTVPNFKNCLDEIWTKTGLPMHITEFDQNGTEAKQQQVYSSLIPVAWEHPHVAGITLWGFIEGQTWISGSGIINSNGTDRSAMTWLRSYLAGKPSLSCCPAPAPFAACDGSNAPVATFTSPANNASYIQGSTIVLTATASDADGSIANVKFYDGSILLTTDNTSAYTYNWTGATVGSHTVKAVATDNSGNITEVIIAIKITVPQSAYNNTMHQIPGIIQAEHFDVGGNEFAYIDNTPGSAVTPVVDFRTTEDVDIENCTDAGGGYNIGYATAGEWLEYTVNVNTAGLYDINLRIACEGTGRTVNLSMDGIAIANNIAIPTTAGWQIWQTVTVKNVNLTAGNKVLRVTIGATDYVNLNYVEFKSIVTNLDEEEGLKGISISPNPFSEEGFRINSDGIGNYEIYTINGVRVVTGSTDKNSSIGGELKPGIYILKIRQENHYKTVKITRK